MLHRSEAKMKKSMQQRLQSPGTSFMNQETSANGTSTPYQAALRSARKQSGPSEAIQLTLRKKTPSRNFPGAPVMSMTL